MVECKDSSTVPKDLNRPQMFSSVAISCVKKKSRRLSTKYFVVCIFLRIDIKKDLWLIFYSKFIALDPLMTQIEEHYKHIYKLKGQMLLLSFGLVRSLGTIVISTGM